MKELGRLRDPDKIQMRNVIFIYFPTKFMKILYPTNKADQIGYVGKELKRPPRDIFEAYRTDIHARKIILHLIEHAQDLLPDMLDLLKCKNEKRCSTARTSSSSRKK